MTKPEQLETNNADRRQLETVAERRGLHRRVRSTFPAYDITCQLTYFWRVAKFPVFHGDSQWWVRFWDGHTSSRVFQYLSLHTQRSKSATNYILRMNLAFFKQQQRQPWNGESWQVTGPNLWWYHVTSDSTVSIISFIHSFAESVQKQQ